MFAKFKIRCLHCLEYWEWHIRIEKEFSVNRRFVYTEELYLVIVKLRAAGLCIYLPESSFLLFYCNSSAETAQG